MGPLVWMHKITWVCGKAVFKWVLVTKLEFARHVHLTGAMIKIHSAMLVKSGAVVGVMCVAGGGVEVGRVIVNYPGALGAFSPTGFRRMVVPEPSSMALLASGAITLLTMRRRKK